jgi:diaminopimelate decarboxylase
VSWRACSPPGATRRVVFSGVGKRPDEMRAALQAGVRCFNVESAAELQTLSAVASAMGKTRAGQPARQPRRRCRHPPVHLHRLKGNKFGVAHDEALRRLPPCAASLPGIRVAGIDCHIGSQITTIAPYLDALDRLLDLVEQVEADGIPIAHLDMGGGLGITYTDEAPPAADLLVGQLLARIDARGHGHRTLLMEPGRSLVGNAGVLLTEVLVLKPGAEKNFCIVDAAMNDMVRPAMYQAWLGIVPCHQRADAPLTWDVVGPVCESGDWLGRDRALAVQPGDVLAVLSAGAYGMAMASDYNTRPRAAEVMVDNGRAMLIRRRETVADLFRDEILPG